jgi:predicted glycosyltransferase
VHSFIIFADICINPSKTEVKKHISDTPLADDLPIPLNPSVILVAPLNWGLGHATRSVNLITRLQKRYPDAELILASDGAARDWLSSRFPDLQVLKLPSYRITYPKGKALIARMALSARRILAAILHEHREIRKLVKEYNIDLIISDNRFGCRHKRVHSVIVTHQIQIASSGSMLSRAAIGVVNGINRWLLKRFDQCWVPDFREPPGLAGTLSHPLNAPAHCTYIGPLSRFSGFRPPGTKAEGADLVCIVSGPDPQRTIFLELLLGQLSRLNHSAIVFAGLPGDNTPRKPWPHITVIPDPDDAMVYNAIKTAKLVISRPGYSTIMDLWAIGNVNAAFVPTPGQTEQEYLAHHLASLGIAPFMPQHAFDLFALIQRSA